LKKSAIAPGSQVSYALSPTTGRFNYKLLASDGSELRSDFLCGALFTDVFVLPADGNYRIEAKPCGMAIGSITLNATAP